MLQRFLAPVALCALVLFTGSCTSPPLRSTNTSPLVSTDIRQGTRYALPLRLLVIQIWQGKINGAASPPYAVLAGTTAVPDPRHQYVLAYQGSSMSTDELSWEVKNGFLASVKAKTKDESLTSLGSAVSLLVEIAKASMSLGGGTPGAKVTEKSMLAQYVVDPLSPRGREQLGAIRTKHKVDIRVYGVNQCDVDPQLPNCGPAAPACVSGIAYRADYPYMLSMEPMAIVEGSGTTESHELLTYGEQVVLLPNQSPVTLMPLTRAAFVEQNMELTLTEGVLTKVTVEKPSQLKSFFDSLIAPVKSLASIPGELLKFRIEQNNNSISLMKNEAQLLTEMRAFLEAQKEHQAYVGKQAAAGSTGSGSGGLPPLEGG